MEGEWMETVLILSYSHLPVLLLFFQTGKSTAFAMLCICDPAISYSWPVSWTAGSINCHSFRGCHAPILNLLLFLWEKGSSSVGLAAFLMLYPLYVTNIILPSGYEPDFPDFF